jgi:CO/xanthine dehydrogenase FAD-binding subunit
MKRFQYLAPVSLDETLALQSDYPEAIPLAGGTDLVVQLKERKREIGTILSLKRVSSLCGIQDNGSLGIGATTSLTKIAGYPSIRHWFPALAMAAQMIGSVQIRNRATIGGNICNAAPSADTASPLLVLEAKVVLKSRTSERQVALTDFFVGPGVTSIQPGEILTKLILPYPPKLSGSSYVRHTPRARMDIAVAGTAASLTLDSQGRVREARLALNAVAPTPFRAIRAERVLINQIPDMDLFRQVALLAAQEAQPIDDLRASASYRRHLIEILLPCALQQAWTLASAGGTGDGA